MVAIATVHMKVITGEILGFILFESGILHNQELSGRNHVISRVNVFHLSGTM